MLCFHNHNHTSNIKPPNETIIIELDGRGSAILGHKTGECKGGDRYFKGGSVKLK